MKILKRAAALTAALLLMTLILIKPIEVSASPAPVLGAPQIIMTPGGLAAGTAGSVLGGICVAGGASIIAAQAVADSLDNGTIDNRVEQFFWDMASEWEYGYNQAQVNGEIFKAELTYGDLKSLAALLSEAYPEGQIQTSRGHIVNLENTSDFPISLPIDTEIYFTDVSQTGETALTYRFYYSDTGVDYSGTITSYELPSGAFQSSRVITLLGSGNYPHTTGFTAQIESDLRIHTHLYLDASPHEADIYMSLRNFPNFLAENTLISYSMPTFVAGEGVGSASSADIQDLIDALEDVPYGMTDDDVAVSIPVSGEDVGDNSGADSKPGVDTSEIIENAPDVPIEGDFSSLKLPKTISTVFPFCLPFDFYNGIRLFSAQPVTPRFEIPVKIPNPTILGGGYVCDEVIVIDLGKFEKIGRLSRVLTTCAFLFFLIQLSTKIVKGAGA